MVLASDCRIRAVRQRHFYIVYIKKGLTAIGKTLIF